MSIVNPLEPNYLEEIAVRIWEETGEEGIYPDEEEFLWLGYAALARAKGVETTSEDVHDIWSAWTTTVDRGHRSLVPFAKIVPRIQAYDDLYRDAIHKVASEGFRKGFLQ